MRTYEFEVEGYLEFPLDMLRYDACWPYNNEAVSEIHDSMNPRIRSERVKNGNPFKVTLSTGQMTPTVGLWSSFSWKVAGANVSGRAR